MRRTKEAREQAEYRAIERLGQAKDWDALIKEMDRQDENREQRERYHEVSMSDVGDYLNTGRRKYGKPQIVREYNLSNLNTTPWEDVIFDSPKEIDQLTSDPITMQGLRKLTDRQKEVLFYRHTRGVPIKNIADGLECGSRNVIKHIKAGIEKFQKHVTPILKARDAQGYALTTTHRQFLKWLENPLQNRKLMREMLESYTLDTWFAQHNTAIERDWYDEDRESVGSGKL